MFEIVDSNLRQRDFPSGSSPRRVVHPPQAPAAVGEDLRIVFTSYALNNGSCDPVENDQAFLAVLYLLLRNQKDGRAEFSNRNLRILFDNSTFVNTSSRSRIEAGNAISNPRQILLTINADSGWISLDSVKQH